jgi:type I restriction-modification system DNA methylase subunit
VDNFELTETMATAETTALTFRNDTDFMADYRLTNPLINDNDWPGELLKDDTRWGYRMPPTGNAKYAWVQ